MSDSEAPNLSSQKLTKLIDKIKADSSLASKLGLLEDSSNKNPKRKAKASPVKFNKVVKSCKKKNASTSQSAFTGSPDENASGKKTSKRGASGNDSSRPSSPNPNDVDNDLEDQSESNNGEDETSEGDDDLENLEMLLCNSDDDLEEEDNPDEESEEDEESFDVLGGPKKGLWAPTKKAFEFYLKAADIELKPDLIKEIKEQYLSESDLDAHFTPPRFPSSLWATVQSSQADTYRLKSLFKVQDNLFLSLKPLLDCLATADKDSKPKIIQSIQLIASSNLHLNRFRRSTIAPHLKAELRKQV